MKNKTKKNKTVKINVIVVNQPSQEAILNTAKILRTLGTSA
ncbi:hypothetical protein [Bacillus sp. CGMCC 1.16541]|nr:hypothetical protein [Bacillus sp. CGMCC 1.16541]